MSKTTYLLSKDLWTSRRIRRFCLQLAVLNLTYVVSLVELRRLPDCTSLKGKAP